MKCNNCGNEFEGKFCPNCGAEIEEEVVVNHEGEVQKPAKCWTIFGLIAYITGIVALAGCWCMLGIACGPYAIVFGILGKKGENKEKAKKGLKFGIIGTAVSVGINMIIYAVIIGSSIDLY